MRQSGLRTTTMGICLVLLASLIWWAPEHFTLAQTSTTSDPAATPNTASPNTNVPPVESETREDSPRGFLGMLKAGGPVGFLIILMSIAAVALVIEHVMTIRQGVLMPPRMGEEVRELLASGHVTQADQRCRMEPSFLAHVLGAGIAEIEGGWSAVEKAMEDATAEQSARLFRKIEYLSVIGNIAPMMGLLGTVMGMVFAFREVADTQGAARAADLAQGIYLALITTVEGLIVAIPSVAAFAVFRNRVDHLVAEVTYVAQHVFLPIKRQQMQSQAAGTPRSGTTASPPTAPPSGPMPPPKRRER